jgi:hypothetical protein
MKPSRLVAMKMRAVVGWGWRCDDVNDAIFWNAGDELGLQCVLLDAAPRLFRIREDGAQ